MNIRCLKICIMGNRFLLYWLPLIVWISGIFLVSSLPRDSFPQSADSFSQSKVISKFPLHIMAFFVLFLLFYRLLRLNSKKQLAGVLVSSFSLTMLISLSKECWQLLIPTRYFNLNDLLIDGGAAFLGILGVCIVSVCNQKIFASIFGKKRD